MLQIDGSLGEGGGQVIRTAISAAAILRKNIRIINIRAKRPKPGLQAQHLTSIIAAAKLSNARFTGEFGSTTLTFTFDEDVKSSSSSLSSSHVSPLGGSFEFDIGSAGATTLVLQTVLPILLCAPFLHHSPLTTTITVTGGTAASFAPPVSFFADSFLPQVNEMCRIHHERNPKMPRITVTVAVQRHGFFPVGGGKIILTVTHSPSILDKSSSMSSSSSSSSSLSTSTIHPIPPTFDGLVSFHSPLHSSSFLTSPFIAPNKSLIAREIFKALPVIQSKTSPMRSSFHSSSSAITTPNPSVVSVVPHSYSLLERGKLISLSSECLTMNLPIGRDIDVANIQAKYIDKELSSMLNLDSTCQLSSKALSVQGTGKGNVVMIKAQFTNVCSIFSGFSSERGKKDDSYSKEAMQVAQEAINEAKVYLTFDKNSTGAAPIHHHLADQLLLPLTLLGGGSFRYLPIENDKHFSTNCDIIEAFFGKVISTSKTAETTLRGGIIVTVISSSTTRTEQHLQLDNLDNDKRHTSQQEYKQDDLKVDNSNDRFEQLDECILKEDNQLNGIKTNTLPEVQKRKRLGKRRRQKLKKRAQAQAAAQLAKSLETISSEVKGDRNVEIDKDIDKDIDNDDDDDDDDDDKEDEKR
jgi:RNA 3'-phosphate cyclase